MASSDRFEQSCARGAMAVPTEGGYVGPGTLPGGARPKAQPIRRVHLVLPDEALRAMPAQPVRPDAAASVLLAPITGDLANRARHLVRAVMRERYLTQWTVASACGITQSTLSAWLCGRKDLSGSNLLAVLEALEIDLTS